MKKREFDQSVFAGLRALGYIVHPESEYSGRSKPDFIATRDGEQFIGETKSPAECKSNSWLADQTFDGERMLRARQHARERIKQGLPRNIACHEIIIIGQIPDYADKIRSGHVNRLPEGVDPAAPTKGMYAVPLAEAESVEAAFANLGYQYAKVDTGGDTLVYLYDLAVPP